MNSGRMLGTAAVGGFAAAFVVHVFTFLDESLPHRFSALWLLHIGLFIVFVPAVLLLVTAQKEGRLKSVFANFPAWVVTFAFVLQTYAVVVGAASFGATQGVAQEQPSGYALVNHGQFIRELTHEEYRHARALETRGFSSVWLVFYGSSALFWLFRRKEAA